MPTNKFHNSFAFLNHVWEIFFSHKFLVLLCILLDALLITGFFYINFQLFLQAQKDVAEISSILQEKTKDINPENAQNFDAFLLADKRFKSVYKSLVSILLLFLTLAFLMTAVLNGLSFFIAKKMAEKTSFLQYFPRFLLLSVFWFLLFLLFIYLRILLTDYTVFHPFPLFTQTFVNMLFAIALIFLAYLSAISVSLAPSKKYFRNAFLLSHNPQFIRAFLLSLFFAVIAVLNVLWGFSVHYAVGVAFLIFLLLPILCFIRVMFVASAKIISNKTSVDEMELNAKNPKLF